MAKLFFPHLYCLLIFADALYSTVVQAQVSPLVETSPVHSSGDAADDVCIWIHPTNASLSTIIATDKQAGLVVYDLNGNEIQYLYDGKMNNVDIRYNFSVGTEKVAIIAASNRSNNSIALYKVNPISRELENVLTGTLLAGIKVYGLCLYHSPISGKYYCFVNSTEGEVEEWEIFDNGSGLATGVLVRSFDVGDQVEGCVTDDALADLYIAEENVGIWKYGAEPGDGSTRRLVDSTSPGGNLTADVEGLTIYYVDISMGYLIASSQGSNNFVIYKLGEDNSYILTFNIVSGNGIDGVSDTDGIDIVNYNLGPLFPHGLFVAQDGNNRGANQNFKLISWEDIAHSVNPPLIMNSLWDPRKVGGIDDPSLPARMGGLLRYPLWE